MLSAAATGFNRTKIGKKRPHAAADYLKTLDPKMAANVAGSYARRQRVLAGESMTDVFNTGKDPVHQLKTLGDVQQDVLLSGKDDSDFLEGRARARGERPKHLKSSTTQGVPAEQLSKLEGDARAYTVGHGKKDGNEYLYAYDLDTGKVLAKTTSGKPGSVLIPLELTELASDAKQRIVYQHNHPDSFSLSLSDLKLLERRPGLAQVIAQGHDGSRYQASRGEMTDFLTTVSAVDHEMNRQVLLAQRRGLSFEGLDAHLVNLALAAENVIHYQYTLSPSLSARFENERATYEQIVDELRYAVQRGRS